MVRRVRVDIHSSALSAALQNWLLHLPGIVLVDFVCCHSACCLGCALGVLITVAALCAIALLLLLQAPHTDRRAA